MDLRTTQLRGIASPEPHEDAVVLTPINDAPSVALMRPSLTCAVRAGALIERPGRGNSSAGAEPENVGERSGGFGQDRNFPVPAPARCRDDGKRKREVSGVTL